MDPRKSSVWSGDDGLPVVSFMGSDESKNRCCVIDNDGSIGMELCEEKVVITARKGCNEKDDFVGNFAEEIDQPEKVTPPNVDGEKDEGEEETVESAAAKKKKKKKAKDKKAAAASVEAKEDKQENSLSEPSRPKKKDVKVKVAEKKVPKHVREMQEILARRKEAEERKKKEEEERLRKEEEEGRRREIEERGRRAPHRGRAIKGS